MWELGTVFFPPSPVGVVEVPFFEDTTLDHWVGNRTMTF
jgi:hypothetical protein